MPSLSINLPSTAMETPLTTHHETTSVEPSDAILTIIENFRKEIYGSFTMKYETSSLER